VAAPGRSSLSTIGKESVPKIVVNNTVNLFFTLQSAFWQVQTITVSECCLTKLLPNILFEKYICMLALKMASPGDQHCANCIGTLSFPISSFLIIIPDTDFDDMWIKIM